MAVPGPSVTPNPTASLSPLPHNLSVGLIPVAAFGILSFSAATLLLLLLTYRMIQWYRRSCPINQFVILISNLLFADCQQSLAFLLNAEWLVKDAIEVGTRTCWAQGWFVSTGDMGSGVWAFTIGLHTFATVVFGYRLSTPKFMTCVALLWVFVYGLAAASVPNHPDLYVRANAWCWVNPKYPRIRLWLHYFWIYFFEFGTVLVYSAMILAVRVRLQSNFYHTKEQAQRAKDAAKLMMAYPLTYVLCTLPLATMRMYSTGNSHRFIPPGWFCFAGAMITSNGWLDVLLYTLTRRVSLLSDEPPTTDNGIESFGTPWRRKAAFGTETFCEHVPDTPHGKPFPRTDSSDTELVYVPEQHHRQRKSTDIIGFVSITEKTTVEVTSEPMTRRERSTVRRLQQQGSSSVPGLDDRTPPCDHEVESECSTRQLWSGDNSSNGDDVGSKPSHRTSHTESHDVDNPPHLVKPAER